jgi:hypothetical protein
MFTPEPEELMFKEGRLTVSEPVPRRFVAPLRFTAGFTVSAVLVGGGGGGGGSGGGGILGADIHILFNLYKG